MKKTLRTEQRLIRLKGFILDYLKKNGVRPDYAAIIKEFGLSEKTKNNAMVQVCKWLRDLRNNHDFSWRTLPSNEYKSNYYKRDLFQGGLPIHTKKVLEAYRKLQKEMGRKPTLEAVGKECGVTGQRIEQQEKILKRRGYMSEKAVVLFLKPVEPFCDLHGRVKEVLFAIDKRIKLNMSVPLELIGKDVGGMSNQNVSQYIRILINSGYIKRRNDVWPKSFYLTEKCKEEFKKLEGLK